MYKKIEYIYKGRNSVHRDIHRQEELNKIFPNKSQSYFKMLGYLEDFIYELKTGIQRLIQLNQSKKERAITEAIN